MLGRAAAGKFNGTELWGAQMRAPARTRLHSDHRIGYTAAMSNIVRTRFAPSPTGYLHIGGARTALFNYLLARNAGGQFLLRIEDTDQTRNIAAADAKLLDDLRWLGLQWDEGPGVGGPCGPYHQSQRLDRYAAAAQQLLATGWAYYAFETREELETMRTSAQKAGQRGFRYPRPERFPSAAEADAARAAGRPVVVRFKLPQRDIIVNDAILGDVTIAATELSDFVLVKADGWPTYHFAVVVDDIAMRITHVLRGQEHLMNTPNHIALFEAFGAPLPVFAHLPIIFNMSGTKMSKREKDKVVRDAVRQRGLSTDQLRTAAGFEPTDRNADETLASWLAGETQLESDRLQRLAAALHLTLPEIDIHDFRRSGYLPEVLLNFIALLGWSPGDDREKFTLDELVQAFTLERIGKTNARFDRDKLLAFNTATAAALPSQRLVPAFRDFAQINELATLAALDDAALAHVLELCAGFRTFADVVLKCGPLFDPDDAYPFDDKAVQKWLLKGDPSGAAVLRDLHPRLAALVDWQPAAIDAAIRTFAEASGLGLGKVAQPLRVAVTGTTISPQISDTLALLGRERTLRRVERALQTAKP